MRILHLDSGREMRGGQWQALRLMRELRTRGHDTALMAPAEAPLAQLAGEERFPVGAHSAAALLGRARAFDLLHCHTAGSHTLAALASARPFAVARRVGFAVGAGVLSRWKYGRAAGFAAVSEFVRRELLAAGVPAAKIRVIPDAVPLPGQSTDRSGGVVTPATADPRKAQELAQTTGLALERSANLERDLAHARVFLYLSEMEGLGSAALLAMAFGVPVVASRVGGLPEIVEHERTGLLVENDAAEVRAAVTRLLRDDGLARRLGEAGRDAVARRHTPERMAELTLALYEEVQR